MSNYKRRNSYDLFLDYVLEQQDKILELSCELENAEELILDNYLETLDENIPDEMHQRFKDAHYKLQSAKRQFEYIEILERHLYKLNSKDKNIEQDFKFYQDLKTAI